MVLNQLVHDAGSNPTPTTWDFSFNSKLAKTTHMLSERSPMKKLYSTSKITNELQGGSTSQ